MTRALEAQIMEIPPLEWLQILRSLNEFAGIKLMCTCGR
ncbi:hypothetical protein COLO4_36838 [Corchorus olitorius]|uniref:Uncharacterized protein n=1 Tax=Corchorus olitorius TaxID=93759 RepID=A0A1R3G4V5_9ROSI|nr:hypothetical protein COLO4_36838 [Corchorus olitorius]